MSNWGERIYSLCLQSYISPLGITSLKNELQSQVSFRLVVGWQYFLGSTITQTDGNQVKTASSVERNGRRVQLGGWPFLSGLSGIDRFWDSSSIDGSASDVRQRGFNPIRTGVAGVLRLTSCRRSVCHLCPQFPVCSSNLSNSASH